MDRRLYIIPAIVSLGVHGILFFGAPETNPRDIKICVKPVDEPTAPPIPSKPFELVPEKTNPEEHLAANIPAPRIGEVPPGIDECLRDAGLKDFVMEVSVERRSATRTEMTHIGDIGVPDGKIDGSAFVTQGNLPVSPGELDNNPTARMQTSPRYPHNAVKDGKNGEVLVDFVVNERGEVVKITIVSSTDPVFEEPTRTAVARWRFAPGLKNGKAVPFRMRIPVSFNLNNA